MERLVDMVSCDALIACDMFWHQVKWSSYVCILKAPKQFPKACFRLDTSSRLLSMHQLLMICEELD